MTVQGIKQGRAWFATEVQMRRAFQSWLNNRRIKQWLHIGPAPVARVEHGRWLVDCPHCNGAELTDKLWNSTICGSCGAEFRQVSWPINMTEIEDVLLVRPPHRQHWFPSETVNQLEDENERYHLPRRVGI